MTNPATEKLLRMAVEQTGMSRDKILAAIAQPEWTAARRVHDWRNHISDELRGLWAELSPESRLLAFSSASLDADAEDWD
jgi:hypothetical protein